MHEPHCLLENIHKDRDGKVLLIIASSKEPWLGCLDIPVAVVIPEEGIDSLRSFIEPVVLHCIMDCLRRRIEAGVNPAIHD